MKILMSRRNNLTVENFQNFDIDDATESELWSILHSENRGKVAFVKNVTNEMLEYLMDDEDSRIRCCVAISAETPEHLLEILAEDPSSNVRSCAVRNPNISLATIKKLCQDPDKGVQYAACAALGTYFAVHPDVLQKELHGQ